jgi:hypothetical protein
MKNTKAETLKEPVVPMFGYSVKLEQYCDHEEHSPEEYGSWSSSSSWTCDRMARKVSEYPDVVSIFDFPVGSNALVVWVQWGSGDSFGHADGAYAECLGMFKDMDSASSLREQVEQWTRSTKGYDYEFTTPDGQVFKSGFAPWIGYFDSLEAVNIEVVAIF